VSKNIIITGASSGFGALTARHLAGDGHTVYAGMRDTAGADSAAVSAATGYARDHGLALIPSRWTSPANGWSTRPSSGSSPRPAASTW
jgi:NAD(P)-dependent dehydrogenase (short-subunit alcohol dehydrogenase family)